MNQPNTVDNKLDFYLQHHALIEEWASLRHHAVEHLVSALLDQVAQISEHERDVPAPVVLTRGKETMIQVALYEGAYVELYLDTRKLFRPSTDGCWPTLAIVTDPTMGKDFRARLSTATRDYARDHDYLDSGHPWWLWHRLLKPPHLPFDVDKYANSSVNALVNAWQVTANTIDN